MHIIDQYAYSNRIRRVDPAHKGGVALVVLLLCLALNKPLVGVTAVCGMALLAVKLAGLSTRTFGRVLLGQAAFLVLATLGVVLSVSLADPRAVAPWALQLGPLWLASSPEALARAVGLVTRALGAAAAMNFLALTTPLVDLVELGRRWRIPDELIDIMTVIYRFIFVLLDGVERMRMAQDSRLGYQTSYLRAMNSAALLGSRLFIDAFQRGKRLQIALESRGYSGGSLRVLPAVYIPDRRVLWAGLALVITLLLAWMVG
ncbi:MAG: Energy-coupling factor transporter transmembrane protein EcfT [Anaerolineae bacterium]|nr:Energy-coupling factor transporter transmembrane protein EcfT [Anaerolineae bacterium]